MFTCMKMVHNFGSGEYGKKRDRVFDRLAFIKTQDSGFTVAQFEEAFRSPDTDLISGARPNV